MVIADLLRFGCVGVLMLVTSPGQLWLVLVEVFAENCGDPFFNPACAGLVPAVVGRGQDLDHCRRLVRRESLPVTCAGALRH
jgi:hypothetical protein